MRIATLTAAACLAAGGIASTSDAQAAIRKETNLAAQGLETALQTFASERDLQIIFRSTLVSPFHTNAIVGELTADEALTQLLSGTGLTYRYLDEKTITITPAAPPSDAAAGDQKPIAASEADGNEAKGAQKRSFWDRFRLAQASSGTDVGTQATRDSEIAPTAVKLEEIVVTAQKRKERLQDVPVPVTAIDANSLLSSNQLGLEDYYVKVPGLSLTSARNSPILAIRGLSTGVGSNPTVSVVVDDAPYGSSTLNGGGVLAADFDPSDLARVEVLRGPQGTLYGATSLGGLIKFVTVDPSTSAFSARLQAGLNDFANGDGLGYAARGSVNVPLTESWAVRASAFMRRDPGYVDSLRSGARGINSVDAEGARLSALWQGSNDLSLKLSALAQEDHELGSSKVTIRPGVSDFQQDSIPGVGWSIRKLFAFSANLTARVGGADLTSVSSYTVNDFADEFDLAQGSNLGIPERNRTPRFTQEIRLSSSLGARVDGMFGFFYSHESSSYLQAVEADDPDTGELVSAVGALSFPSTVKEYAVFSDVTFHITDAFDIQLGGRESFNRQTYTQSGTGAYAGFALPQLSSKDNSFTYLVTPRFRMSPDWMLYARFASGYRIGGPNSAPPGSGAPAEFGPDKTQNYEIGLKGDVLNHLLAVDASVYYIDWKDIQLPAFGSGITFVVNGGSAKSQGMELSVESRPLKGLTVSASVAYSDAELTGDLGSLSVAAGTYGISGDRLPYSSRFSGSLSLNQEFPLSGEASGFVGATVSRVSDRRGDFLGFDTASGTRVPRVDLPAYTKLDVLAGLRSGPWTLNLFANNLTDERGLLQGPRSNDPQQLFDIIQPRTIGLSLVRQF